MPLEKYIAVRQAAANNLNNLIIIGLIKKVVSVISREGYSQNNDFYNLDTKSMRGFSLRSGIMDLDPALELKGI